MRTPEFHIHVDAREITPEFEELIVRRYGFWRDDFLNDLEGASGYAPDHHLTIKPAGDEFVRISDELLHYLREYPTAMIGYLECESLPRVQHLPWQKFISTVPVPFHLELTQLASGSFREAEIHVHLDWKQSDKRLIAKLREMGLMTAYKADHRTAIYTVQGSRQHINELWPLLLNYLKQTGGAADCWVFEERIPDNRWWISPEFPLPPVVAKIVRI